MKRTMPAFLAVTGFLVLTGCSGIQTISSGTYKTLSLKEAEQRGEELAKDLQGQDAGVIIEIEKGQEVPLVLEGKSPVLSLVSGDNRIKFEQDVYLLISPKGVMLSPDGKRFASISRMKALKKLFGMKEGFFSVGFGVSEEKGPEIRVAFESK